MYKKKPTWETRGKISHISENLKLQPISWNNRRINIRWGILLLAPPPPFCHVLHRLLVLLLCHLPSYFAICPLFCHLPPCSATCYIGYLTSFYTTSATCPPILPFAPCSATCHSVLLCAWCDERNVRTISIWLRVGFKPSYFAICPLFCHLPPCSATCYICNLSSCYATSATCPPILQLFSKLYNLQHCSVASNSGENLLY